MLIDEILSGIDISSKESLYTQTVFNNPIYRNREICLLLTNNNGFILSIKYCESCKKNTIYTARGTCCCPSHNESSKRSLVWDNYFSKEYSFRYHNGNDYYPVYAK